MKFLDLLNDPNKPIFNVLLGLYSARTYILYGSVFLAIFATSLVIYKKLESHKSQVQLQQLQQQSQEKLQIFQKMQNLQSSKVLQNVNLAGLSKQLKTILQTNKIQTEEIKWSFTPTLNADIQATQTSDLIFQLLNQLNNTQNIEFTEINISKLHNNNLVQLQTNIIVKTGVNQ